MMNLRRVYIGLALGYFGILLIALYAFLNNRPPLDASQPIAHELFSSYGAFISGVIGPALALAGVLLLLRSIRDQNHAFARQQIESRFFQLLTIARENTRDVEIRTISGPKLFIHLIDELEISYDTIRSFLSDHNIEDSDIRNVAYLAFFYGAVGQSSVAMLKSRLRGMFSNEVIEGMLALYIINRDIIKHPYTLFDGHQSRLGHYYRHLFQTVKYIDSQPACMLSYKDKYQYIKSLRAQLSTHEQILFLWNSISELGSNWERSKEISCNNDRLITKYNMVKNIPSGCSEQIEAKEYYPEIYYEDTIAKPASRLNLEDRYS